MKKYIVRCLYFLLFLFSAAGCNIKNQWGNPVGGALNEILVVTDEAIWKGGIGDSIKAFFCQPMFGLPQPEPIFKVISVSKEYFVRSLKSHRAILKIDVDVSLDTAYAVSVLKNTWATGQNMFEIRIKDSLGFQAFFEKYRYSLMSLFLDAEKKRLVRLYRMNADTTIFRHMKQKYDVELSAPSGYYIRKDSADFVWMSLETVRNSRGVVFFQKEYVDEKQFDKQDIIRTLSRELSRHIPGPRAGSYMILDTVTPIMVEHFTYDRKYYAMNLRGMWTVHNDFMGGPVTANIVLDTEKGRILYVMGYVYAPDEKKRNYLHQVNSVVNTLELGEKGKKKERTIENPEK